MNRKRLTESEIDEMEKFFNRIGEAGEDLERKAPDIESKLTIITRDSGLSLIKEIRELIKEKNDILQFGVKIIKDYEKRIDDMYNNFTNEVDILGPRSDGPPIRRPGNTNL
jgi:hypothetical protein